MADPSATTPAKDIGKRDELVEDVYAVKAKKGESVIMRGELHSRETLPRW